MKQFFLNLKRHLILYLVAIIGSTMLSVYVVKLINLPRNEETFCVFLASYTTDVEPLHHKMINNRPSYLREVQIYSYQVDNEYLLSYFAVVGCTQSDLAIIPESIINDDLITNNFLTYNQFIVDKYFPEGEFFELNDNKYGILVHKKDEKNLDNTITYSTNEADDNYYAFIRKNSIHGGGSAGSSYYTSYEYINLLRGL